jgi:hypothetical protein
MSSKLACWIRMTASGRRVPRLGLASIAGVVLFLTMGPFGLRPLPAHANDPAFNTVHPFGNNEQVLDVAVGDLNGDGALDLVAGNNGQNYVYLSDGLGNFASAQPFGDTARTEGVAVGDLNGDGALDLIVSNNTAQDYVYLNDGSGAFHAGSVDCAAPPANVRCFGGDSENTWSAAVGDLNGDGVLDVVVGSYPTSQQNRVYFNDGAGSLSLASSLPNPGRTESVALGDLNGDGALDLIVGNADHQDQPNLVYLNDGSGGFDLGSPFGDKDWTTSVALGDLNCDGALDLVVANYHQQNVVYLNDGSGSFDAGTPFGLTESATDVALGDLNNDGALDVVVGRYGNQNRFYLNDGSGTLDSGTPFGGRDITTGVAVGDLNGDGALDLVVGNDTHRGLVYLNDGAAPLVSDNPVGNPDASRSMAVGDLDGDGALDLVVGNWGQQNVVYLNNGSGSFPSSSPFGTADQTRSVALGDLDGDGALDLVVGNLGQNYAYLNDGTGTFGPGAPFGGSDDTEDVALGDLDGDGDLDLVVGNWGQQDLVYLNGGAGDFATGIPFGSPDGTLGLALGDLDGDGDLDLVVGNWLQQNRVYSNVGGGTFTPGCFFGDVVSTEDVAVGDLNGDGWLDLIAGNWGEHNRIYMNDGLGVFGSGSSFGGWSDTLSVAIGDIDGDGALDLVVGNDGQNYVYLNDGAGNFASGIPSGGEDNTQGVALGDLNADGALDLVVGNDSQQNQVYLNGARLTAHPANNAPYLTVTRPLTTGNADFYSTPVVLDSRTISLPYTLFDPEANIVGRISAFYSLDGGGRWLPAVATADTITTNLAASSWPTGTSHVFGWDIYASGVFGQSDNVVVRLAAYPQPVYTGITVTYRYTNSVAGPYQWAYAAAATFPFRVRGTQVRVVSGTTPVANALVYRLPAGQSSGGTLLADGSGTPFRTDRQGYLQGRGEMEPGDRLLAMAPVTASESYMLYHTNGTPTEMGLDAYTVTQAGVQTLTVSADRPLLLFDLDVSLEWDAHNDPTYLQQLEFDLKRASQHLYDFTDGQVALGEVIVHQNADYWLPSHVVVQATNRLRPLAIQGGIVLTTTVDPQHADIVYDIGQVRMGATWNRYGSPGYTPSGDWPLALAHELSHYLLFQDDVYMGLNDDGLLIPVDTCSGSAMGDMYDPDNTEFIYDEGHWADACADSLANRTLGRTEWETLRLWYPELVTPTVANPGPSLMPFDVTEVTLLDPITPTAALADPTFFIDYAYGEVGSSNARAFLLRDETIAVEGYDYVIDLGSPLGGQNRVLARGTQPGDRLCVFDPSLYQYGCEVVAVGDDRLGLERDQAWKPVIQLSPITSQTLRVEVGGLPATLTIQARLYPEYGFGGQTLTLAHSGDTYSATFQLLYPAMVGHVQVWVDETASEANPRRETIVAYTVGGNPGGDRSAWPASRGLWPASRGLWPASRGLWPASRGLWAPLVSPNGQMILFTENPSHFDVGELYTIQSMAGLPDLPEGKTVIGEGYRLVASPAVTRVLTGSISFQYHSADVLLEGADEEELTIHFWDDGIWQALPTVRAPYYNLASAPGQGAGVYALLAGVTTPHVESTSPSAATNDVTTTLTVHGHGFLSPVELALVGPAATHVLPIVSVSPVALTAVVTKALPAREYQVIVTNRNEPGGGVISPTPGVFVLYEPADACFYDTFESGAGKWQRDGDWAIAVLPQNQRSMTDSPEGNYDGATPPAVTQTTHITSQPFSLSGCPAPMLSFRHDYVIAHVGASQDAGLVEISADGGATWTELGSYSGGGVYGPVHVPALESSEWTNAEWKDVTIDLSAFTGTVQLRFGLLVDRDVSDKGWVIDDVTVHSGPSSSPLEKRAFLPLVLKDH